MFDSLTIAAVADELNRRACPAKIQRVLALGPLALGLELYVQEHRRRQLIISAHPDHARLHLSDQPLTRDPALSDSPLLLLLRKYVRGGRLLTVAQPGLERVLLLSIAKILPLGKDSHTYYTESVNTSDDNDAEEEENGEEVRVRLIVEMMGRHSNIIMVDEGGTIMDSLKRVPASLNRYRVILPHQPYVAPPAQDKLDFARLTPTSLQAAVQDAAHSGGDKKGGGQLWQALVATLQATSPQMAKEIVYRATASVSTPTAEFATWPDLYAAARELFSLKQSNAWQPGVVYAPMPEDEANPRDDNSAIPHAPALAFAAYQLRHLAAGGNRLVATDTISAAVEAYFSSVEQTAAHEQMKEQLRGKLAARRAKVASRLHSLGLQLARADESESLRYKGEMIFAYMHTLEPNATSLSVPAPDGEGEISIALDPQLTPVENAQRYFKDYRKAVAARASLPEMAAAAEQELAYLDEMVAMVDFAAGYEDIALTARELADLDKPAPPPKPNKQKGKLGRGKDKAAAPPGLGKLLRLTSPDGMEVYVGKSMRQNDYLAFKLSAPDDLWFHARGVPGAHVLVKMRGMPNIPPRTLMYAAGLAAGRSQARANTAAEVMYTLARHLRKPPGAPPGAVTFSHEKSIRVPPIILDPNARTATG